jgi:outer membrane protein OmpA-like peptidoglycan-associated protein
MRQRTAQGNTGGLFHSSTLLPAMALQRQCGCRAAGGCSDCERESSLQRSAQSGFESRRSATVTPIVHDVLSSSGQPLDASARDFFEPRFGHDFSNVRVHSDTQAAESARSVDALAYTVGKHIVFGAGQYAPQTRRGRELLAHELTHTLQQGDGPHAIREVSNSEDQAEIEASEVAERIVSQQFDSTNNSEGRSVSVQSHSSLGRLLRTETLENDPSTAPAMACAPAIDTLTDYLMNIQFAEGSAVVSNPDKAILADFATEWNLSTVQPTVRVDGFASIKGGPAQNWPLSCDRAFAVANELVTPSVGGKPGIPAGSVEMFANGETDRFSTAFTPNQTAAIHAPGLAQPITREPSVHSWLIANTGSTDARNCCDVCPVDLDVDCDPPKFRNGIEFTISIRDHNPAYSYDVKRTLEAKHHQTPELSSGATGPWETIPGGTRPAGTSDDSHDSDECLVAQASGSVHQIFSEDRPGFESLGGGNNAYLQKVNFVEFVRITRSDGTTYDDPYQQNWHTRLLVAKSGGVWSINMLESEIGPGHLASLDP